MLAAYAHPRLCAALVERPLRDRAPDPALEAAAAVRRRIPPESFHIGHGHLEVSTVELVLELSQQALRASLAPNRLPQCRGLRRGEVNGDMYAHAEDDTHTRDNAGHAET